MEAKTMGSFIAALRKANGMTQKDLAEKLNVSDKSVSRWERDEGAPDLSLIPVIAEVFGITCDELLRGERKPEAMRTEPGAEEPLTPKADKQRRRLLKTALAKYRSRTLVSAAVAFLGLLGAMICNFAFLRSTLGFFVAVIFYLAAGVCQTIFLNSALFAVSDADEEDGEDVHLFKKNAKALCGWVFAWIALLLIITLPLITLNIDALWGLGAGSWALEAFKYLLVAAFLCVIGYFVWEGWRLRKNAGRSPVAVHNWRLKGIIAVICALVMLVTIACSAALLDSNRIAEARGETFSDFDSFKAFMETETTAATHNDAMQTAVEMVEYDEEGKILFMSEEPEYLPEVVRIDDGTPQGKVLGYFLWKNRTVVSYWVDFEDAENIRYTVVTDAVWQEAKAAQRTGFIICAAVCLLEAAAAVWIYKKLKAR
ncbi:MAG: helix-turn-helix transcriptional regulator [Clostridia bacterium]|nr:helix-turn-helix transcriptional regulator [Clostridia bacterium]